MAEIGSFKFNKDVESRGQTSLDPNFKSYQPNSKRPVKKHAAMESNPEERLIYSNSSVEHRNAEQRDTESELRLKIDLFIVPPVALIYLFSFIDRANMVLQPFNPRISVTDNRAGNAKIAGMDVELGMKGNDYSAINSIFFTSYILCQVPSNILCKWIGPGWFIPSTTLLFGACSFATAFVNTVPQAAGVRFVLGIFEAGMFPGIAYYMSRWYRRSELAFRLGLYLVAAPLAGAFGGLLASAILTLDQFGSLRGWRMIFAIEGIVTMMLGLVGFLVVTDGPETARWLTSEEKELAMSRIRSERVGTAVLLDKIDTTKLLRGVFSPITLSTAFVFLLDNIIVQSLSYFAPTIIKTIYPDKPLVKQQLYTAPPYAVGAIFTLIVPLLSWRLDHRQLFITLSAPLIMIGYSMFLASKDSLVRYSALFLVTSSAFFPGALTNAQVAANVVGDTARNSAIGTNVMVGCMGGLISAWTFMPSDAPYYHVGNGLNLAAAGTILVVSSLTFGWMKRDNRRREEVLAEGKERLGGMSEEEIENLDWIHPEFRWKP